MKVTGSTIQQLDKTRPDGRPLPRSECRRWRLWATTELGRKSRRFHGTWTQAQDALSAFVSELEGFVPDSELFASYAESWRLWRAESGGFSPNTLKSDECAVAALCRTGLASMRLDEITPQACRDALLHLKRNPMRGDELRPSTLAKYRSALSSIMAQAEGDGRVAANPVDKVDPPKVRFEEREALSPDELALLLNRLDAMPLDGRLMAVYLMCCLGLRCGESVALKADAIDSRYAHVTTTNRAADNSIGPAKTNAGVRVLPVPPRLAAKVDEWMPIRAALGCSCDELCCNSRGGRLSTSAVSGWWRGGKGYVGARDKLGCPGMTLHQLRHSNLSMVARHMGAFDLKSYAGWASIAPARIYVHDDLDSVERAVQMAWA